MVQSESSPSRRAVLRWLAAGGVAGGVSLLVLAPRGESCRRVVPCGECGQFAGCGLPRAELARKERPSRA